MLQNPEEINKDYIVYIEDTLGLFCLYCKVPTKDCKLCKINCKDCLSLLGQKDTMSDAEHTVEKKSRPKIKRREVVDGKPKLGRPKKADIQKKKKPGIVGRPVGDAGRIAEFKARLLATAGDTVITKIIETALTDGHPSQGAMLKFCGDRLLPLSSFEAKGNNSMPHISINISGITSPTVDANEVIDDVTDVYIKDVE